MIRLTIVNKCKDLKASRLEAFFQNTCQYFLQKKIRNKKLLKEKKEISLVFLKSSEMKIINFKFRKKNKATDVLSFAGVEADSLGELLFCIDVLKSQARKQKHSLESEFRYMLIHGLLHLLGYDHELSKNEEKLMFRLQDQCFKKLNTK